MQRKNAAALVYRTSVLIAIIFTQSTDSANTCHLGMLQQDKRTQNELLQDMFAPFGNVVHKALYCVCTAFASIYTWWCIHYSAHFVCSLALTNKVTRFGESATRALATKLPSLGEYASMRAGMHTGWLCLFVWWIIELLRRDKSGATTRQVLTPSALAS